MIVVIMKDGKPVDAYKHSTGEGIIQIDYSSPMAQLYLNRTK
jgi:hypothetical protein